MSALEHTQSTPPLASTSGDWWSPLGFSEAGAALQLLGAQPVDGGRGKPRYEICVGNDVFAPTMAFEVTELGRGCRVHVREVEASFSRDFACFAHLMLGGFAGLVFFFAALTTEGDAFLRAVVAILAVWALFMGLFAAARTLMTTLAGEPAALQSVRARARVALFAQAS